MKRKLILALACMLSGVAMAFSDDPSSFWLRAAIGVLAACCLGLGLAYYLGRPGTSIWGIPLGRKVSLVLGTVLFGTIMAFRNDVSGMWLRAGIGGVAAIFLCLAWMYVPRDR